MPPGVGQAEHLAGRRAPLHFAILPLPQAQPLTPVSSKLAPGIDLSFYRHRRRRLMTASAITLPDSQLPGIMMAMAADRRRVSQIWAPISAR